MSVSNYPTNPTLEQAHELQLGDTVTVEYGPVDATGEIVDFTTRTDTEVTIVFTRRGLTFTYTVDVDGPQRATV